MDASPGRFDLTPEQKKELATAYDAVLDLIVFLRDPVPGVRADGTPIRVPLELKPTHAIIMWAVRAADLSDLPHDLSSLSERVELPRATVTRHVAELSHVGMLTMTKSGRRVTINRSHPIDWTRLLAVCNAASKIAKVCPPIILEKAVAQSEHD